MSKRFAGRLFLAITLDLRAGTRRRLSIRRLSLPSKTSPQNAHLFCAWSSCRRSARRLNSSGSRRNARRSLSNGERSRSRVRAPADTLRFRQIARWLPSRRVMRVRRYVEHPIDDHRIPEGDRGLPCHFHKFRISGHVQARLRHFLQPLPFMDVSFRVFTDKTPSTRPWRHGWNKNTLLVPVLELP